MYAVRGKNDHLLPKTVGHAKNHRWWKTLAFSTIYGLGARPQPLHEKCMVGRACALNFDRDDLGWLNRINIDKFEETLCTGFNAIAVFPCASLTDFLNKTLILFLF